MERRNLGQSRLQVPVVGMGTWRTFDVCGQQEEQARRAIVDEALSVGANFFDSSPMYGEAERAQAERALEYFGGSVDLYQIHNLVNWREHLEMLEQLRDQGKVRAIGATHYSVSAFEELRHVMKTGHINAIQIPYTPLHREVEQDILPLAADLNLGVVVMQPMGGGSLIRNAPANADLEPLHPFWRDDLGAGAAQVGSQRSALPCGYPGNLAPWPHDRECYRWQPSLVWPR
jgi:aryl-alcohol dehydrogenase-like predicted oxidoreductase